MNSLKENILTIDIGTSGVKVCLIDQTGKILAKEFGSYHFAQDDQTDQYSPLIWWEAVVNAVRRISNSISKSPEAIFLTGQMQSLIYLKNGQAIYPAIIYSDTRAIDEINYIHRWYGEEKLVDLTGNQNDGSSVFAKMLWIKNHENTIHSEADHVLFSAHDFINYQLCQSYFTDYTNASTTGLFDIHNNQYAKELIASIGLRHDWFPELCRADEQTGVLNDTVSEALNLPAGIPIYHGAGDAASATIGSGAGELGNYYVYLGTSGWLATTGIDRLIDPLTGLWNLRHIDPEKMIYIGPMLTAAGNWQWIKETIGELESEGNLPAESKYEVMEKLASSSPAGSNKLIYLPMIKGERSPIRDANARGVFFGIHSKTNRADLYRSVFEGVAFAMRSIRDVILNVLPEFSQPKSLYLTGGGARSKLWAQIFADVMACNVSILASPEDVGVSGMAIIAGKVLGWHSNYLPEGMFLQKEVEFIPSDNSKIYDAHFEIYKQIYPSLKDLFKASTQFLGE